MAIFVQSAPQAVALAVKQTGVWVAWGRGDPGWDVMPIPEPVNATALTDEAGRRRAQVVEYCTPDAAGSIVVPQGTYAISVAPTKHLYVRCNFANADAVGEEIREGAVFTGATLSPSVPIGQDYFLPADVLTIGQMLMLERFAKITRSVDFSVSLEFVMTL